MAEPVLVTGATGFVGGHLVRALATDGVEVHALVRAGRQLDAGDGVTVHVLADPVLDAPAVIDAVRPRVVVHLATHFAAQHDPSLLRELVEANVTLGTAVAEACTRTGARLVHATSAWQHFEGAEYAPVSLYAATKQAFVDVLAYYTQVAGLVAAEVCLFDTYGPRDTRRKLVTLLLDAARTGDRLALGSGRQLIDPVHVDDVVAAIRLAAAGAVDGGRLVVGGGAPRTVRELVALVGDVTGRVLDVEWGARPDRPRECYTEWPIAATPNPWRPAIGLREGLATLWREEFA